MIADPSGVALTVGGELKKLASNISLGPNFAGVHWRTDYLEGVKLSQEVTIELLPEQTLRYNENRRETDGQTIRIE